MLKPLEAITQPDSRHDFFVRVNLETGQTNRIAFADFHASVSGLGLSPSVPQDIATQFDLARNAYLYSWYVYELTVLGTQQAYAITEMALNRRAEQEGAPTGIGMKKLLRHAVDSGWISDSGFSVAQARHQMRAELPDFVTANVAIVEEPYVEVLVRTLPALRNGMAHGNQYLMPPGQLLETLGICRDLINQLFPQDP